MIQTEFIEINGRSLVRTYSSIGRMVENQDGVRYIEAIDPIGTGRLYTETNEPIPTVESSRIDALENHVNDMEQVQNAYLGI